MREESIGGGRGYGGTSPLRHLINLAASFAPLDLIFGGSRNADRFHIRNEEEFWMLVEEGRVVDGSKVMLKGFLVSDWCPLWPGRYHQSDVSEILRRVDASPRAEPGILFPAQKQDMIEAGIGTIRLVPKNGRMVLGATSSGWLHAGIPVVAEKGRNLAQQLSVGVVRCDIEGTVAVVPQHDGPSLGYRRGIPRLWIEETRILDSNQVDGVYCMASGAILYGRPAADGQKNWSFYYFNPVGRAGVKGAVSKLEEYMFKYPPFNTKVPVVLAEFDEVEAHFARSESSLAEFYQTRGTNLKAYIHDKRIFIKQADVRAEHLTMNQTQNVTAGRDVNAPVTQSGGNSNVSSAVDLSETSPVLDDLLKSLLAEVGKLPDEGKGAEIKRDANGLDQELRSESPRKPFWEMSLNGIKDAASALGEIAVPVLSLATSLASFLAGK